MRMYQVLKYVETKTALTKGKGLKTQSIFRIIEVSV